jgi:hypothetical protein
MLLHVHTLPGSRAQWPLMFLGTTGWCKPLGDKEALPGLLELGTPSSRPAPIGLALERSEGPRKNHHPFFRGQKFQESFESFLTPGHPHLTWQLPSFPFPKGPASTCSRWPPTPLSYAGS